MWFSPLKGAHLTLGQLDKTLPVDISEDANKKIERGTFVYIANGTGAADVPQFKIYTAEQAAKANAVPYIALMGVYDSQAGMAGNDVQAPVADEVDKLTGVGTAQSTWIQTASKDSEKPYFGPQGSIRGPRITAISVMQPAEYQTSAYSGDITYVGQPLTVGDAGELVPWAAGKNIVGYVTATPKKRWVNDLGASALGARISGGNVNVIEFSTAWIPAATINADTAFSALSVDKKAASTPKAATTK